MSARARTLRRRTKPSLAARIRRLWVVGLFVLIIVAAIAVTFVNLPQFRVRSIDVALAPNAFVNKQEVLDAANIDRDANIWLIHPGASMRRVEAIPYVALARMHRLQFPEPRVLIDVTLRRAASCLEGPDGLATIDDAAPPRILQRGCDPARLVVIATNDAVGEPGTLAGGTAVQRQLADLRQIVAGGLPVRRIARDRYEGLVVTGPGGLTVQFGSDDDLAAKIPLVEPIRRTVAAGRKIRSIDVRAPKTPIVEFQ